MNAFVTWSLLEAKLYIAEKATRAALYGIAVQHADDGYFRCGNSDY